MARFFRRYFRHLEQQHQSFPSSTFSDPSDARRGGGSLLFSHRKLFAAQVSFDTPTAAPLATRLTHGVGVARFSTQPSAVLSQLRYIHSSVPSDPSDARRRDGSLLDSQHCHTPSDVLRRPRPTIGVEDSQLPTLDILPHGGCDIPPAAVSATTYDARRENGSLLSKTNLLVSRYDTSSTHPKRCLQRPRPTNGVNGSQLLLFFYLRTVLPQLSRLNTLQKLPVETNPGKRMHNDHGRVRPAMP